METEIRGDYPDRVFTDRGKIFIFVHRMLRNAVAGSEFLGKFSEFLQSKGIRHAFSTEASKNKAFWGMDILVQLFCYRIAEIASEKCRCLKHGLRCMHEERTCATICMKNESFILNILRDTDFKEEAHHRGLCVDASTFNFEHKYSFLTEVYKVFLDLNYPVDHDYFGQILRKRGWNKSVFS